MKKSRKTTKRTPPSVPKCVRKYADGYTTGIITCPNGEHIQFKFKKLSFGYVVLKNDIDKAVTVNLSNDFRVAPMIHKHFSNLKTLKSAIEATENWLGFSLPDIR